MAAPSAATWRVVQRVVDALDYGVLASVYCDHGGDAFWADRRPAVAARGREWAGELAARLPRDGVSLYVGAGVAELPAMLTEVLDLGRRVVACNLRTAECDALNRALEQCGQTLRVCHQDAAQVGDTYDHVSLVSVLCDPETFPLVSAVTYGRVHPVHVDPDAFGAERARVRGLVEVLLGRLRLPGLVTTTAEEAPWILAWAEPGSVQVDADDTLVEAAVVGDPIGFLRLRR